jgi:Kef-type K+ transport system membrane component KefB
MTDMPILAALVPVVVLLALGIATAIGSRALGLSPIVGYIALGIGLKVVGVRMVFEEATISILAELGVVFLLFDVGLHFSLKHIRQRAGDIFAFGPVQVLIATFVLGLVALLFGLSPLPAFLVGAVLSMSSTAVVARLIAERHQQSCPVGQTATAILVFQDVAAIFLLIVVGSLNSTTGLALVTALALAKAAAAFGATVLIARLFIRPLLALVAATGNEEVFTATALVIALAAGWATGQIGLSLTLGAFLGGLTLAETPYRVVIQSEIAPFRGLLLGFFFIYVGFSLDVPVIAQSWYAVVGVAALFVAVKVMTNIAASLVFRWSVPGSTQLGFLLSQGSEFAFVILSLPAVRALVGESRASVLVAAVALSMAATPNLAEAGRALAGSMRRRQRKAVDPELIPRATTAPVVIVGMGRIGRTVADALIGFEIGYVGIELDQRRLREAIADGYSASFGDAGDIRMWQSIEMQSRQISVLTAPRFEVVSDNSPLAAAQYPHLKRIAAAADEAQAAQFHNIGVKAVVERGDPHGSHTAAAVLTEMGCDAAKIAEWMRQLTDRVAAKATVSPPAVAA